IGVLALLIYHPPIERRMPPAEWGAFLMRSRNCGISDSRYVDAAVALEQSLMRNRQEGEVRVEVLVVDLDAPGESGGRVACHDQADEHRIHIDLVHVRGGGAAKPPAVGGGRIDFGGEGGDVARGSG